MTARFTGDYVADWASLSLEVRTLAGHRCARCHHPFEANGKPLACDMACDLVRGRLAEPRPQFPAQHDWWTPGLNFGIHHLDGRKDHNVWWNLLPLCNSCHLTIQARVIPERPWMWEHSDWFKPYVAGFYAFYYRDADITRDEAEAYLDLWLAVGQPWLYAEVARP